MSRERSDGECGLERRSYAIHRIGLLDDGHVGEFRRRRIDVTAGRDDERHVLLAQPRGDRPNALALQVHIEDRQVEAALVRHRERVRDRFACRGHRMTERLEEILEHHRDQRLVLDDKDGSLPHGAMR
jgi:hypothetical protein